MIDSFQPNLPLGAFVSAMLCLSAAYVAAEEDAPPLRIYAAASLTGVLPDALAEWNGDAILIHAGSSTLARQIEQGADADLFISADPDWADYLAKADLTEGAPVELLGNALVVVAHKNTAPAPAPPFPEAALLATADVNSVPAGRYARRALEAAGDWPTKARLLQTAHVREALAWAARGEVDFAIVYRSDAKAEPRVRTVAEFPEDPDRPIRYVGVVVAGAGALAGEALEYLKGGEAQAAFARHGFTALHK